MIVRKSLLKIPFLCFGLAIMISSCYKSPNEDLYDSYAERITQNQDKIERFPSALERPDHDSVIYMLEDVCRLEYAAFMAKYAANSKDEVEILMELGSTIEILEAFNILNQIKELDFSAGEKSEKAWKDLLESMKAQDSSKEWREWIGSMEIQDSSIQDENANNSIGFSQRWKNVELNTEDISLKLEVSHLKIKMSKRSNFQISLTAKNISNDTIDPHLHWLQLDINGKASIAWGLSGNGFQTKRDELTALPPGEEVSITRSALGEGLFSAPGKYTLVFRLMDLELEPITVQVDE